MRIAILEDTPEDAQLLMEWLNGAGHQCHVYASGRSFVGVAARETFDVMLIDWEVPDMSGIAALQWVRANLRERVPVLFITGREAEEDIVHALAAGADDYLVKPPRRLELLARIVALGRRALALDPPSVLDCFPYRVDTGRGTILLRGRGVELRQKEYELALFLFRNIGRLLSRNHIEEAVWGRTAGIQSRTLDTHLSHLRRKLGLNPSNGYRLVSVYNHGYRLEGIGESAPGHADVGETGGSMMLALKLCSLAVALGLAGATLADDHVYIVRQGDTLIGIGARLLAEPSRWSALVKPNNISNPDFLVPGRTLRIPWRLMRSEPEYATIIQTQGSSSAAGRAVSIGSRVGVGEDLITGADGYLTLELADGSRLLLPAHSGMRVMELRKYSGAEIRVSRMRLLAGRLEALVKRLGTGNAGRFEVDTPTAAIGVRGTDFRASLGGAAVTLRAEVLDGVVALGSGHNPAAGEARIEAGFGAVVDDNGKVSAPVRLLGPPDVAGFPPLFERPLVRLRLGHAAGAVAHRVQVLRKVPPMEVLSEQIVSSEEVRVAGLADGEYLLKVRAVDALGLEGRVASHEFRLKARPEPPFVAAPADRAKLRSSGVEFAWSQAADAAQYRLQLARSPKFEDIARDVLTGQNTSFTIDNVVPGEYYWRVASLRANGDQGPFGDMQRFTLLSLPPAPEPAREEGGRFHFRWGSEAGQIFEFQIARDAAFTQVMTDLKLNEARVAIERPPAGRYFMRLRAIDTDGFVGPYTATQSFEVPACVLSGATGLCVTGGDTQHIWHPQ